MSADCTASGITRALQRRLMGCNIGLREVEETAYLHETLWQRIKRAFTRRGRPTYVNHYVEVAVIDYPRWRAVKAAVESVVNELRPAGVEFRVNVFRGTEDA